VSRCISSFVAGSALAAATSIGSEFVEVSFRLELNGAEVFHPVFVVETGRTADIQQTFDPNADVQVQTAADAFGMQQRLLATVTRADDRAFHVRAEYMQRRGDHWLTVLGPSFLVREGIPATSHVSTRGGASFDVSLSVLPRYDVASLADVAGFHSQPCEEQCEHSAAGVPSADASVESGDLDFSTQNHHCCRISCQNGNIMRCCNACCSDSASCPPGATCCAP